MLSYKLPIPLHRMSGEYVVRTSPDDLGHDRFDPYTAMNHGCA